MIISNNTKQEKKQDRHCVKPAINLWQCTTEMIQNVYPWVKLAQFIYTLCIPPCPRVDLIMKQN